MNNQNVRNKSFYESQYPFPVCNHKGAEENNIGYTIGVFDDGIPFEAEIWCDDGYISMGIIMPYVDCIISDLPQINIPSNNKLVGYHNEKRMTDFSVLCVGMVEEGYEENLTVVQEYVEYLCEKNVVEFCSNMMNGTVEYLTDRLGNSLVNVIITLGDEKTEWAIPHLNFKNFSSNQSVKNRFKIIK